MLLGDSGTTVRTTCLRLLRSSVRPQVEIATFQTERSTPCVRHRVISKINRTRAVGKLQSNISHPRIRDALNIDDKNNSVETVRLIPAAEAWRHHSVEQ